MAYWYSCLATNNPETMTCTTVLMVSSELIMVTANDVPLTGEDKQK